MISIAGLIFGIGIGIGVVLAIFRVYIDQDSPDEALTAPLGRFRSLTPSQRALGKFFVLVVLVLLLQILAGALLGHYYADRRSFYGIDIGAWLPFNFLRSVHVQAPIVWIGLGWIAAALFLAPFIGGREPPAQRWLVNAFFVIICIIAVGTFCGDYVGIRGWLGGAWFWLGDQGLEYLELGRAWQILFFVGLLAWSGICGSNGPSSCSRPPSRAIS